VRISSLLMLVVSSLVSLPGAAHHSAAMFDNNVVLTLKGTVTRFDYLNPHSWLYVEVENEDGGTSEWGFELGAPPLLRRAGVSPNYWVAGDMVVVKTNPLKDGRPAGNLVGAMRSDGRSFGNVDGIESP
jgi:hypothetical protein